MIKELKNEEELSELIKKGNVVVKFEASWCGPCKVLNRIIESIDGSIDVNFVRVDVDEFDQLAGKYLVSNIPTCFAYKDGEVTNFKVNGKEETALLGALNEEEFVRVLKDTFNL